MSKERLSHWLKELVENGGIKITDQSLVDEALAASLTQSVQSSNPDSTEVTINVAHSQQAIATQSQEAEQSDEDSSQDKLSNAGSVGEETSGSDVNEGLESAKTSNSEGQPKTPSASQSAASSVETPESKYTRVSAATTSNSTLPMITAGVGALTLQSQPSPVVTNKSKSSAGADAHAQVSHRAQRGRTQMGPQGEHVSAYVLLEEFIMASIEGKPLKEVPTALKSAMSVLDLGDKHQELINEVITELKEVMETRCIEQAERKLITRNLRGVNYIIPHKDPLEKALQNDWKLSDAAKKALGDGLKRLTEISDYRKVKELIRLGNRALIAPSVAKLVDACALGANKMQYASFPEEGNVENPNTGREKSAKNDLRLLSEFILAVEEAKKEYPNKKDRNLQIFLDDTLPQELKGKWGITEKIITAILQEEILLEDMIFDNEIDEKIGEYMNQLFFYHHLEQEEMLSADSREWQETKARKYNKSAMPRDKYLDKLYQLTGRHIVLVMNAFEGLQCLGTDTKSTIVDQFLGKVLTEQKWKKEGIDVDMFMNSIRDKCFIEFDTDEYCMQSSVRGATLEKTKTSVLQRS